MERAQGEFKVLLFSGDVEKVTPSNSLVVFRNQMKWTTNKELVQQTVFMDGDDLIFRSTDGTAEILRLDLMLLLKNSYMRMKSNALGMKIDHRLALAQCLREKGRELGIQLISKDDWDDIFNVMVRPHRSEEAAQYRIDDN